MKTVREVCKGLLQKLFNPPALVTILCDVIAAAAMILVFSRQYLGPFVYLVYLTSAYALTITVIAVSSNAGSALAKAADSHIVRKLRSFGSIDRYFSDIALRTRISLYFALIINLAYGAMKLFSGIWLLSFWLISLGLYYLILAALRFAVIDLDRRHGIGDNLTAEFRRSRLCGVILLILNLVLMVLTAMVIFLHEVFIFPGKLLMCMACYSFYAVISASVRLRTIGRHGSPLLSTAKSISFTAALVSMLSLEVAMTSHYGNDPHFAAIMTSCVGIAVCLIVLALAIAMIMKANKGLNKINQNDR